MRPECTSIRSRVSRRRFLTIGGTGLSGVSILAARYAPDALGQALFGTNPPDRLTWGIHISLVGSWFDPAETAGSIAPYMVLYALHDALVKPLPGEPTAPCLADSWSASPDGLTYEFRLRPARFHNGEPVTADDVKFSFERYRGVSANILRDRVTMIETLSAQRVRFVLKRPWPDFMTFYTRATGAGWIVPKAYVEQVGVEGFKRAPIGAGPYRFISWNPGIELVFEAFDHYWRKRPAVRHLIFKVIPDESTRVAALKRGDVDIVYLIRGILAEELQRTAGLALKPASVHANLWVYFPEQWDPRSPWHDRRVRLAANHALNRPAINQAENLGYSRLTGSIVPSSFEFYWQPPGYAHDPVLAKQLLAAAGYPNGFDAGDYYCDVSYNSLAEAVVNDLQAVGIRTRLRALERAAFFKGYGERQFKNLIQGGSGAPGSAVTRIEAFATSGGAYVHGGYPDIDALFRDQQSELDRTKQEAMLHRIQRLIHEKVMFAPLWELVSLNGVGPRVSEGGFGLIPGYPYSAPYEDLKTRNP